MNYECGRKQCCGHSADFQRVIKGLQTIVRDLVTILKTKISNFWLGISLTFELYSDQLRLADNNLLAFR